MPGSGRIGANPTSQVGFLHDRGEHHDVRRACPRVLARGCRIHVGTALQGLRAVRVPPRPLPGDGGMALHGPLELRAGLHAARRGPDRDAPGRGAGAHPHHRRRRERSRRPAGPAQLDDHDRPPRPGDPTWRPLREHRRRGGRPPGAGGALPPHAGAVRQDEVHRAARRVPHRRHVRLRPQGHRDRAASPDPHLPRCRRRRDLPPHPPHRGRGLGSHVHRPVRLTRIWAGRSATRSRRSTSATAPTCATSRSRSGGAG